MGKKIVMYALCFFSMTLFCSEESVKERAEEITSNLQNDFSYYKERRNKLIEKIKETYPGTNNGVIVLFGNPLFDVAEFKQERNFFYLTGINEPGMILLLDVSSGKSTLYIPGNMQDWAVWAAVQPEFLIEDPTNILHVDQIEKLDGEYIGHFFKSADEVYAGLYQQLTNTVKTGGNIFTIVLDGVPEYLYQWYMLNQLYEFVPEVKDHIKDITAILFRMRKIKEEREIACLQKAVDITIKAQLAAAQAIKAGKTECEIRGIIDATILAQKSAVGFHSVVASGKNSVILHKSPDGTVLEDGDLVIVDIGAECPCHYYSADLARTYPVSGKFTGEQRKIYNTVLEAQRRSIQNAKPGCWIGFGQGKGKSLFLMIREFFAQAGYGDENFPHGLGHHIGLDAHEESQHTKTFLNEPLAAGNVIALEPGLYFPAKKLGIRIESNCIVTKNGGVCLDTALPKTAEAIEKLMQQE